MSSDARLKPPASARLRSLRASARLAEAPPARRRRAPLPLKPSERLWRLRKRQQSIDAILRDDVMLEFVMNGKRVTVRRWPSRSKAIKAATEKRKELERAGWATHW